MQKGFTCHGGEETPYGEGRVKTEVAPVEVSTRGRGPMRLFAMARCKSSKFFRKILSLSHLFWRDGSAVPR